MKLLMRARASSRLGSSKRGLARKGRTILPALTALADSQGYALPRTIQTISAITPMTRMTPTQTPAWNTSPISSQALSPNAAVAVNEKNTKFFMVSPPSVYRDHYDVIALSCSNTFKVLARAAMYTTESLSRGLLAARCKNFHLSCFPELFAAFLYTSNTKL